MTRNRGSDEIGGSARASQSFQPGAAIRRHWRLPSAANDNPAPFWLRVARAALLVLMGLLVGWMLRHEF
jgi:hypothetical protein